MASPCDSHALHMGDRVVMSGRPYIHSFVDGAYCQCLLERLFASRRSAMPLRIALARPWDPRVLMDCAACFSLAAAFPRALSYARGGSVSWSEYPLV
jgi:hypothetical protein